MNVEKMFDQLVHVDFFDEKCLELLNKIMELDNPMKFDDAFASDDDLDKLEDELERLETRAPQAVRFKQIVHGLAPCKVPDLPFI